jgi:hypothetical protein
VDLATGATKRLTTAAGGWTRPTLSPDGKTIAYIGFAKNDDSRRVADLWTMSADGRNATLRSAGFDREPEGLVWAADGSALYFTAEDKGSVHLYSWSLHGGIRQVTSGAEVVLTPSAGRGTIAAVRSDFRSPKDVVLINPRSSDAPQRITHLNDEALRGVNLAKAEEISFDSSGGARIQGWIVKPPDFDPSRRYPLLLEIHGGPHGMYNVGFEPAFQNFAANGYVLLFINPRGSTGYGNAFTNAIAKHYPGVDYDDLMAGVDTVIKQGAIDESRMFVSGCSRGRALSGDGLDQHGWRNGYSVLHVPLFQETVLGGSDRLARGVHHNARGQRQDPDSADDGRARQAHTLPSDRGVLRGPQVSRRAFGAAALRRRISRHGQKAVELDAHAALYDGLVQPLREYGSAAAAMRSGHRPA